MFDLFSMENDSELDNIDVENSEIKNDETAVDAAADPQKPVEVNITEEQAAQEPRTYVINTRSGVFHYPSCDGAQSIYKKNRKEVTATRKELTDQGYTPCGSCEP